MAFNLSLTVHILFGTLGVFFFWRALLARKGSAPHRAAGKRFFIVLLMVAASVGPVLFLRPLPFDPGHVVQFAYLALCLVTVTTIGWTAIRWKADPERFRGRHFKILGPVLALLGRLGARGGPCQRRPGGRRAVMGRPGVWLGHDAFRLDAKAVASPVVAELAPERGVRPVHCGAWHLAVCVVALGGRPRRVPHGDGLVPHRRAGGGDCPSAGLRSPAGGAVAVRGFANRHALKANLCKQRPKPSQRASRQTGGQEWAAFAPCVTAMSLEWIGALAPSATCWPVEQPPLALHTSAMFSRPMATAPSRTAVNLPPKWTACAPATGKALPVLVAPSP